MQTPVKPTLFLIGLVAVAGCGKATADVTGRVTCEGKGVVGSILISPKGEDADNTGPAVTATLDEDGKFETRLQSIGKHTVVVTPKDVKFPVPVGQFDYPCDRSAQERDLQAGHNELIIELLPRK
jgi:hypothetical protein